MAEKAGTENRFPDDLRGLRVIVLGAGRSGRAAALLLTRHDALITLVDDNPAVMVPEDLDHIVSSHVRLVLGDVRPELVTAADAIVTSPGVPPTHPLLVRARERALPVIGELELGSRFATAPMIAVTGTNGKTTTVRWIAHLLGKAGKHALVCGNVGVALCRVIEEQPDWFVIEVSSYQLETIERFRPAVAAILNLSPDHLDRHPTPADYLAVKARIAANQQADDALVLNADDEAVWSLAADATPAVWGFSLSRSLDWGISCIDGQVVVRAGPDDEPQPLLAADAIGLPGRHNRANALAAATVAWVCGVGGEAIADGLRDFPGVEHRLERIREWHGVTFVNDSKATNTDSLAVALHSFDRPLVLIAGGRGKGAPYEELTPLIASRVRHLIVLGEETERMKAAWGGHVATTRVREMEEAVATAADCAQPGDVVLLSPACASFDMYRDFEERGRHFRDLVMRLE